LRIKGKSFIIIEEVYEILIGVFVEKVYCVYFVQKHENKSLGISNNVILVLLLDMTFFRCGLYKMINFTNK
jgi:hypothetical protein